MSVVCGSAAPPARPARRTPSRRTRRSRERQRRPAQRNSVVAGRLAKTPQKAAQRIASVNSVGSTAMGRAAAAAAGGRARRVALGRRTRVLAEAIGHRDSMIPRCPPITAGRRSAPHSLPSPPRPYSTRMDPTPPRRDPPRRPPATPSFRRAGPPPSCWRKCLAPGISCRLYPDPRAGTHEQLGSAPARSRSSPATPAPPAHDHRLCLAAHGAPARRARSARRRRPGPRNGAVLLLSSTASSPARRSPRWPLVAAPALAAGRRRLGAGGLGV